MSSVPAVPHASAVPTAMRFIGVALHVSGTARAVRCPAVCKKHRSVKSRTIFSTHRAACAAPLMWWDSPGGLRRSASVVSGLVLGSYPGFGIPALSRSQANYGICLISMHRFMRCSKSIVAATLVEDRSGSRSRSRPRARRGSHPNRMPPARRIVGRATRRGCSMGATRSRSRN